MMKLKCSLLYLSMFAFFVFGCSFSHAREAFAANGEPSPANIQALVQKIKADAEKQIIANHGQSTFDSFKKKFSQKYPLSKYPLPKNSDSCELFALPSQQKESTVHLEILDQSGAYYVTGIEAIFIGRPDVAKWCFASAASLAPMCPLHLSNLGFVLNIEKDFKNAMILLKYARKLEPKDSSISINLAFSYQYLTMYDEAIQAYISAIALSPYITKYHEMLLAVQKKKEKAIVSAASHVQKDPKPDKSQQLSNALKMLEEKKQKELQEDLDQELSTITPAQTSSKGKAKPSLDPQRRFGSDFYSVQSIDLGAFGLPFNNFCDMAVFLNGLAGEYEQTEAPKDVPESMKKISKMTGQNMYILFKGYAHEAALACGNKSLADQIAESAREGVQKIRKDFFTPKKTKPKKETFRSVYLGPVKISKGSKGTYKISVSAGIVGGEFKYNPKTYNFGVKGSVGPQLKMGLGPVGGELSAEAYFEVDLDQGPMAGLDAKSSASVVGQKLEGTHKIGKVSLENLVK